MKTIYIVRHAKAEGQPFSAKLTDRGREQAQMLIAFFKDKEINRIYSSSFVRALETIKPLAELRNLDIIEDKRLGERVLSSVNYEDWQDKLKESFSDFELVFEGGESQSSGMERAASILKDLIASEEDHIVLVTHGNLSTLLLRYFDEKVGFDHLMKMSNPDVFEIKGTHEGTVWKRIWSGE
ncbi:histidine phosphatase family protein [Bacillus sp. ISL-47]|uniref:histidine phosphatase family protein n=1 Tax=Bacillus sp. ISL-47 TaxID=2819130 RepID=UPI001BE82839|nr:histidine phosphatase family protein [Bacillus sp. ISL-47]MBT2687000.1 histidine phosphatase family protein [Bacillus sp. ISL-47]MBT2709392.1 histidine phosphatase family protein [Pseudomonas sp. ISL-84]